MKDKVLEAVIFDIDGTIIDTERIQSDAFVKVLNNHGIENTQLTQHGTVHHPGETTRDTWKRLKIAHDIPVDIEVLTEHKRQATMDELDGELISMRGFITLIEDLRKHNVKLALASSAQKNRIDKIIERLQLIGYFDTVVSANDVEKVKPAPDAYLKAIERLGVAPSRAIVLEDAEVGVQSAHAAHIKVIAVPNEYTKSMNFEAADLIVNSLKDVNYEILNSLVKA